MVQLKQVSLRLKSIQNIKKITKTMKMVSASKLTRAERELKAARPFGYGPRKFYDSSRLVTATVDPKLEDKPKETPQVEITAVDDKNIRRIMVAMTSDRGLCGGVHSGVSRRIKRDMKGKKEDGASERIVCVGEKSKSMLHRVFSESILINIKEIGRTPPIFADASLIAAAISEAGYIFDIGDIYYNKYHTAVKYELEVVPFFDKKKIQAAPNMNAFDDVEEDQLESYAEWTIAALLFYALKEGAASEQSARMAAMDNATKNADEMIRKLNLLFNRTRQAVITRELIEIISGAAALK